MHFCKKCDSMLRPKGGKLACPNCGESTDKQVSPKEKVKHTPEEEADEVVVREANEDLAVLQKTRVECPSCGHKEAAYWFEQTRSADEAPTRFYRCMKCRQTWREYS